MFEISVIITCHREGLLVGPALKSALSAIEHIRETSNVSSEVIFVRDRSDETTKTLINEAHLNGSARLLDVDFGDPGQSRNAGIEIAKGRFVTFLDGDDLWSFNWLSEAWAAAQVYPGCIWHSECNVTFGRERNIWWHLDSDSYLFDPEYLSWGNYWDALSFAETVIYRQFPFRPNDLKGGFGHEDWDWNRITDAAQIAHKVVANTIHFKRRRIRSQMARVSESDSVVRPLNR